MALLGTFTLNSNYVIIEALEQTIVIPLGNVAIGTIVQIGDSVVEWDVDDKVLYKNVNNANIKNNDTTWQVINQADIYLKYESPA